MHVPCHCHLRNLYHVGHMHVLVFSFHIVVVYLSLANRLACPVLPSPPSKITIPTVVAQVRASTCTSSNLKHHALFQDAPSVWWAGYLLIHHLHRSICTSNIRAIGTPVCLVVGHLQLGIVVESVPLGRLDRFTVQGNRDMSEEHWLQLHEELLQLLQAEGLQELVDQKECHFLEKGDEVLCAIADRAWSQLQAGTSEGGVGCKRLYAATQLCLAISRGKRAEASGDEELAREALRCADMAQIVGGTVDLSCETADHLVHWLQEQGHLPLECAASDDHRLNDDSRQALFPEIKLESTIASETDISPADFKTKYFKTDTPVVLKGRAAGWPAYEKWARASFWVQTVGPRTFPIELDNSATSESLVEEPMTMQEFVRSYLQTDDAGKNSANKVAYLAQHDIFDRIPVLLDDVTVPEECLECGGVEKANCWIGTAGTITPLHFDTYDNLLCQIVGCKYVKLFSREQTPFLYCESGRDSSGTRAQKNISAVDVENPDLAKFPEMAKAVGHDVVLYPGDVLFIPQRYWHYVRSLSPSVSVNFWF